MNNQVVDIEIQRVINGVITSVHDQLAVEEPLEIQLIYSTSTGRMQKNIAVTMRTPGNDVELAAGFLFTEGIIAGKGSIKEIKSFNDSENKILVILHENIQPNLHHAERNFYSTSSCGICGKASIDAIRTNIVFETAKDNIFLDLNLFNHLQDQLKTKQLVFENTGGIHASALFDLKGNFLMLREDVGRHNALDKIIGAVLLQDELPLNKSILLLSGRASFELVQKAAMAGMKIVVAVGAPSNLAVELAKETGITLIGFLRNNRFNIYAGNQRLKIN